MRRRRGFTLIELVMALALAAVVLLGVFSILASMIQNEVQSLRKGTVTGWALASVVAMNREIASGSVLAYPPRGIGDDSLVICTNWSRLMNPPNGAALIGGPTFYFSYCWEPGAHLLRRMRIDGPCPPPGTPPPACGAATYGNDSVIATGVYRDALNDPLFLADPDVASVVHLRYVVGNPEAGVSAGGNDKTFLTNPQSLAFDTRVALENKQFGDSND